MDKRRLILITLALIFGFALRLYKFDSPIADWHSHRQADTASVTKIFHENKIDLLRPRYHDFSDVQSGIENPHGYRMVEFPIYNLFSVGVARVSGLTIEKSLRLMSIILSLGSAILIYLTAFQFTRSFAPSFLSLLTFLILPFNIYYSRAILPEPAAVFFMTLSLFLFSKNIWLSAIALSLAILVKPFTVLIIFPALLWIALKNYLKTPSKTKFFAKHLIFTFISVLPFALWRLWIRQFPEGIPYAAWLLNNSQSTTFPTWFMGVNLSFLNKLVAFRPHWFKWLFFERISSLILGGFGLIPLFLGTVYKKDRTSGFSFSLIIGIIIYFVIVAQGNIQHDYYQVLIIPSLSILIGFGTYYLYEYTYKSKLLSTFVILVIAAFSIYFSWSKVEAYYKINHPEIITAGQKVKEILPQNSLVIAPYLGDTALLYQTGKSGWPAEIYDIPRLIEQHPDNPIYFVSVNYDNYTNSMIAKYPTVYKTGEFIILKISP